MEFASVSANPVDKSQNIKKCSAKTIKAHQIHLKGFITQTPCFKVPKTTLNPHSNSFYAFLNVENNLNEIFGVKFWGFPVEWILSTLQKPAG